jgi:hypothetical protein
MSPFQEFRLWLRRAPAAERASAGVAAAVVFAVLIWVLIPSSASGGGQSTLGFGGALPSNGSGTGGTGPAGPNAGAATGPGTGLGSGAGTGTGPGAGSGAGTGANNGVGSATGHNGGRSCPSSNAKGVTNSQIKIGIGIVNILGLNNNGTFGTASVQLQEQAYKAAIDDLNARGGVACRKIAYKYYQLDPSSQSGLSSACTQMSSDGIFALLDSGGFAQASTAYDCFSKYKIVYIGSYLVDEDVREQNYPYIFEFGSYDRIYYNTVTGLTSLGFTSASNGFKKLGIIYRSCFPNVVNRTVAWWKSIAHLATSQITTASLGCTQTGVTPDSTIRRAVIALQNAHVTHVSYVESVADIGSFTKDAQQQGAHFKYGLPDDELVTLTQIGSATAADGTQLNGAIAIASARDSEEVTAGMSPSAGTKRCDQLLAKEHIAPTYRQPYAVGNACDDVWMLEAMINHAPALQSNAMAAGLQAAGSIDLSFPQGPTYYRTQGETAGSQYYRPVKFIKGGCPSWYSGAGHQGSSGGCWHVLNPNYTRSTWRPA